MILDRLYLYNFRNYEQLEVVLSPDCNLFYGANAQGKTSLLEAIYLFITGRSFRTTHMGELIRYHSPHFYLESYFSLGGVEQKLKIWSDGKQRKISYNDTPCASLTSLLGILRGVILTPEDIELITGAPASRRRFLNIHLAQIDPLYVHHLTRYQRALEQRNKLLKMQQTVSIDSWEEEMAISSAYLTLRRGEAMADLSPRAQAVHRSLSETKEQLSLHYKGAVGWDNTLEGLKQAFIALFERHRPREMILGGTMSGPHRDELFVELDGREARTFASQGQQRCCVASLRLAEWQRLRGLSETPPLMLIDDIGISLDATRQERLYQQLSGMGQVFISSPASHDLPRETALYRVEAGRCYRCEAACVGG